MKKKMICFLLCGLIMVNVNGCGTAKNNDANTSQTEQQKNESAVKEDQEISEEEKNGSEQGANIPEESVEEQNGSEQGANIPEESVEEQNESELGADIPEMSVEEQNGSPQGL